MKFSVLMPTKQYEINIWLGLKKIVKLIGKSN